MPVNNKRVGLSYKLLAGWQSCRACPCHGQLPPSDGNLTAVVEWSMPRKARARRGQRRKALSVCTFWVQYSTHPCTQTTTQTAARHAQALYPSTLFPTVGPGSGSDQPRRGCTRMPRIHTQTMPSPSPSRQSRQSVAAQPVPQSHPDLSLPDQADHLLQ